LLPSDREEVRERYESLSAETREHRFLASVPHLVDAMLEHLVDEVDGIDHVALARVVIGADNVGRSVGVARMIRYRNEPEAADVAVTVDDAWQGRGMATALLVDLRCFAAGSGQFTPRHRMTWAPWRGGPPRPGSRSSRR
jgi:GNAT superfamily N-acetyltransferase